MKRYFFFSSQNSQNLGDKKVIRFMHLTDTYVQLNVLCNCVITNRVKVHNDLGINVTQKLEVNI